MIGILIVSFLYPVLKTAATALHSGPGFLLDSKSGVPVAVLDGFRMAGRANDRPSLDSSDSYKFPGIRYGNVSRWEDATLNLDHSYKQYPAVPAEGFPCTSSEEQCLYLDVYVPNITLKSSPVLLWVHGGAFNFGSKDEYPAIALAKSVGAVVVTFNYRLGAFGFLSTGDEIVPGNFGVTDAKLAFTWTRRFIHLFGGNPDRITVAGQSAGASVMTAMLLDLTIRGQVESAISMSGSVFAPRNIRNEGFPTVAKLAKLLGCTTNSSRAMIDCLKTRSSEEILRVSQGTEFSGAPAIAGRPWRMIPDERTIPSDPMAFMETQSVKLRGMFLSGFMAQDASSLLDYAYWDQLASEDGLTLEWIRTVAIPDFLSVFFGCKHDDPTEDQVETLFDYFNFANLTALDRSRAIIRMFTLQFSTPAIQEAETYGRLSQQGSHLYSISYVHDFKPNAFADKPRALELLGAFHFQDVLYLFGPEIFRDPYEHSYEKLTEQMRSIFRQVMQAGRIDFPTPNSTAETVLLLDQSREWRLNEQMDVAGELEFMRHLKVGNCGKPV